MVLWLLMWSPADRRLHGCSASPRESCVRRELFLVNHLLFTLWRSRGAIGRYQKATGGLCAAAGVPRRPMDGADGIPGGGRGLSKNGTERDI